MKPKASTFFLRPLGIFLSLYLGVYLSRADLDALLEMVAAAYGNP